MQNIIKRDEYLNRIIDRKENGLLRSLPESEDAVRVFCCQSVL